MVLEIALALDSNGPNTISLIIQGVIAVSTTVAAGVAVLGYRKWRAQVRGKADFDAARRIQATCSRLRRALANFRRPVVEWAESAAVDADVDKEMIDLIKRGYRTRWEQVETEIEALEEAALEVDVLWGTNLEEKHDDIAHDLRDMGDYLQNHINCLDSEEYRQAYGIEGWEKFQSLVWKDEGHSDPLGDNIDAALNVFESEAQHRLKDFEV